MLKQNSQPCNSNQLSKQMFNATATDVTSQIVYSLGNTKCYKQTSGITITSYMMDWSN
jgi:hypothetical protein